MSTLQMNPVRLDARVTTPGELRLTRRGRLVVFLVGLAVVLGIGLVLAAGSVASPEPEATTVVTVGTGDTLWAIAADAAEDGEVRTMMARIERLNGLESTALVAGQELRVPAP